MHICTCGIHIYEHKHTYMHACMHTDRNTDMKTYRHTHVRVYICIYTYLIYLLTYLYSYVVYICIAISIIWIYMIETLKYTCTCPYSYTLRRHAHLPACIHTHMHTLMQVCMHLSSLHSTGNRPQPLKPEPEIPKTLHPKIKLGVSENRGP